MAMVSIADFVAGILAGDIAGDVAGGWERAMRAVGRPAVEIAAGARQSIGAARRETCLVSWEVGRRARKPAGGPDLVAQMVAAVPRQGLVRYL
jgi:hypothetical protein